MTKRIAAKVDEYQKDGQIKGKYVDIGVILNNQNGEYMLLDPSVNLAGVLLKQQALSQKTGKPTSGSVMCSIFDNQQQQGYQQRPQQAPAQQQGYQQRPPPQQQAPAQQQGGFDNFDDDIPFN